jgi:FkbM family methyltransferase
MEKWTEVRKESDGTRMHVVHHSKWASDFTRRFKNHEVNSNQKLKELLKYLPDNSYIIDVGGHVGDTGLYLATLLKLNHSKKNISVIIIEPEESKNEFTRSMIKANQLSNVILIPYGVSDEKTSGYLQHHQYGNAGATQVKYGKGSINIDTIDHLCSSYNVSLMHIDVEGMEMKCLLGSMHTLKNTQYVMIELNDITERSGEYKFLERNGFTKLNDQKIYRENGNVLFEKTTLCVPHPMTSH